jgi:hypothetical protein
MADEEDLETYVSAKRTGFSFDGKVHLSFRDAVGYAMRNEENESGSFGEAESVLGVLIERRMDERGLSCAAGNELGASRRTRLAATRTKSAPTERRGYSGDPPSPSFCMKHTILPNEPISDRRWGVFLQVRRSQTAATAEETRERVRTNMCFCETNPPILSWKTAVITQRHNALHHKNLRKNGGFVFQNEPTGRVFLRVKRRKLGGFGAGFGVPNAVMWIDIMPPIPKLTPMHLAINVTRYAQR